MSRKERGVHPYYIDEKTDDMTFYICHFLPSRLLFNEELAYAFFK
jgi:hypothetical protein